jgi:hypothetical protein
MFHPTYRDFDYIHKRRFLQTAQNHAAQISLLRDEKDKADSKQAQMQKEMKDEVERLRTQFLFRVRSTVVFSPFHLDYNIP